jgi:hypothetical protein
MLNVTFFLSGASHILAGVFKITKLGVLSLEVQIGERNPNFTGRMSLDRNFLFQTGPSGITFVILFHLETRFSKFCGIYRPPPQT